MDNTVNLRSPIETDGYLIWCLYENTWLWVNCNCAGHVLTSVPAYNGVKWSCILALYLIFTFSWLKVYLTQFHAPKWVSWLGMDTKHKTGKLRFILIWFVVYGPVWHSDIMWNHHHLYRHKTQKWMVNTALHFYIRVHNQSIKGVMLRESIKRKIRG